MPRRSRSHMVVVAVVYIGLYLFVFVQLWGASDGGEALPYFPLGLVFDILSFPFLLVPILGLVPGLIANALFWAYCISRLLGRRHDGKPSLGGRPDGATP